MGEVLIKTGVAAEDGDDLRAPLGRQLLPGDLGDDLMAEGVEGVGGVCKGENGDKRDDPSHAGFTYDGKTVEMPRTRVYHRPMPLLRDRSRLLLASLLALCGCAERPPGPDISITNMGFGEQAVPLMMLFHVHNAGDETARITDLQVHVMGQLYLPASKEDEIGTPDFHVERLDKELRPDVTYRVLGAVEAFEVAAGETEELKAVLLWHGADQQPPAVAVHRAKFVLKDGAKMLTESEPVMFLTQNREGVIDRMRAATAGGERSALAHLNRMAKEECTKTEETKRFIRAINEN